ncbi:hypothetical protein I3760_06G059600 [Carya illinoinensis]|nr:hypothetical protein I3760_06G059600 [Carya illinoinensis]
MSSSGPQGPTPFAGRVGPPLKGAMARHPGPWESPQQPTTADASNRSQESTGCVEDWLDIFCCCCLFKACF